MWSVKKEAPTYLKPAESLTTLRDSGDIITICTSSADQTTWIALIHKTQGLHNAYTMCRSWACVWCRSERQICRSNQIPGAYLTPKFDVFRLRLRFLSAKDDAEWTDIQPAIDHITIFMQRTAFAVGNSWSKLNGCGMWEIFARCGSGMFLMDMGIGQDWVPQ